jgi:hypothetical protein
MINLKRVTFSGVGTKNQLTVRALIDVLNSAITFLQALDPDTPADWEVLRIRIGRTISLTVASPNANGAISNGIGELRSLQKSGQQKIAPRISTAVLESTKNLTELRKEGFELRSISSPGTKTVKVTPRLMRRVDELVKPARTFRYEWTTVEGVMDQVTAEDGASKFKFRIAHPLTGAEILCSFDHSIVELERVKDALPHRVAVYGRAKIDAKGKIASIEACQLRKLPEASAFPSISSLPKTNITGGMDATEYVERVRGGD